MSSKSLLKKCTQAVHQTNKLLKSASTLQLRNFQKPNKSATSSSYAFAKVAPLLKSSKSQRKQYSATTAQQINENSKQGLPLRSTIVILCVGMGVAAWYLWEDEIAVAEGDRKPRVVILGSGWGALSCLKEIDANEYEVVVVSPRNYFLFTPLLPSATVGTLQPKSIIEPIRKYCKRNNIHSQYFEAKCVDVIPERNVIVCQDVDQLNKGNVETFEVPYDHLVVSVGAVNNTFGTPGVYENCYFLKEIEDAQKIRKRIIDCFETANLPEQTEEIKKKLLSFVVVGGGPNGVEFAAEFHDFLHEDLSNWYPHLYPYVKITLIELMDHILNTFDKRISDFAEKKFRRDLIDLKVNSMVSAVTKDAVVIKPMEKGKPSEKAEEIPYGLCVWSTGINTNPLTTKIIQKFPQTQNNRRALVTDRFLAVQGTNNVYAIGDCATINQERMLNKFLDLFREHDKDKNGFLSSQEFEELVNKEGHKYPQLEEYANRANILFHEADLDKDNQINEGEFKEILSKLDSKLKLLPATAQVASQQGRYLGKLFNKKAYKEKLEPFRYRHLGSFAYVGTERAVAEFPNRFVLNGYGAWWLWRSVYLSKQFSLKNKFAVAGDWVKKTISGRDITRL